MMQVKFCENVISLEELLPLIILILMTLSVESHLVMNRINLMNPLLDTYDHLIMYMDFYESVFITKGVIVL